MKRFFEMLFHPERFYKIDELIIGAHCGCCGKWIKDSIVPNDGDRVNICNECTVKTY